MQGMSILPVKSGVLDIFREQKNHVFPIYKYIFFKFILFRRYDLKYFKKNLPYKKKRWVGALQEGNCKSEEKASLFFLRVSDNIDPDTCYFSF